MKAYAWGSALVAATAMAGLCGAAVHFVAAAAVLGGMSCEEFQEATSAATFGSSCGAILFSLLFVASISGAVLLISGSGMMYVAGRLRRQVLRKLLERQVQGEELARVRSTLLYHHVGTVLSIASTQAVVAVAFLNALNLFGDSGESQEEFATSLIATADIVGDVAGILLLSGIGALLVREDPGAGDVGGHIRGLLHSAVLTSQAEMAFEGRVDADVRTGVCIASFPGKFLGDWHALTWACEQGDLGSACVFLPKADPLRRFGQHMTNPDTGSCWCHSLYGEEKPWGCLWFSAWQRNVDLAAELQLELVAVFFPGQSGQGIVEWNELCNADLWDGIGMGGSQKCEVAYMRMRGFRVTEMDLETFRRDFPHLSRGNSSRSSSSDRR